MKWEKSCGAIVYRGQGEAMQVLLICHKNGGHWAFPKGHVEHGETDPETARREILEETGLQTEIDISFRSMVSYSPKPGIMKDVIYFAAVVTDGTLNKQEEEVRDILWVPLSEAEGKITYENDRQVLNAFTKYVRGTHKILKRSMFQIYVKNSSKAVRYYQLAFNAPLTANILNTDGTYYHAELDIHGQILAVSETGSNSGACGTAGNTMQFCLQFNLGEEECVQRAYDVLKKGGNVLVPLGPCDFSPLMADLIDPFGVRWCLFI